MPATLRRRRGAAQNAAPAPENPSDGAQPAGLVASPAAAPRAAGAAGAAHDDEEHLGLVAWLWHQWKWLVGFVSGPMESFVQGPKWLLPPLLFFIALGMIGPMAAQAIVKPMLDPGFTVQDFLDWFHDASGISSVTLPQFLFTAVVVWVLHAVRPSLLVGCTVIAWVYGRGKFMVSCTKLWATDGLCHPIDDSLESSSSRVDTSDFFTIYAAMLVAVYTECKRFGLSNVTMALWIAAHFIFGGPVAFPLFLITLLYLERNTPLANRRRSSPWTPHAYMLVAFVGGLFYFYNTVDMIREAQQRALVQGVEARAPSPANVPAMWYFIYAQKTEETPIGSYYVVGAYTVVYILAILFVPSIQVKPAPAATTRRQRCNEITAVFVTWIARLAAVMAETWSLGGAICMWFFIREYAPNQRLLGVNIDMETGPVAAALSYFDVAARGDAAPRGDGGGAPAAAAGAAAPAAAAADDRNRAIASPTWRTACRWGPFWLFVLCAVQAARDAWSPPLFFTACAAAVVCWAGPWLWRAMYGLFVHTFDGISKPARVIAVCSVAVSLALIALGYPVYYTLLLVITAALVWYAAVLSDDNDRRDFLAVVLEATAAAARVALPSLIGVFTYEGFRAAFDPKYGSVVFLDVFRLLGDFTLPAPGLPFTLIGSGLLAGWACNQLLLPVFPRTVAPPRRRLSTGLKFAAVAFVIVSALLLSVSWKQEACKLNPGYEYALPAGHPPLSGKYATGDYVCPGQRRQHGLEQEVRDLAVMNARVEGTTKVRRVQHPKSSGCASGRFEVLPHINPAYAHGAFQPGAVYPLQARFSNGHTRPGSDNSPDVRGMAIKLIGVPGERAVPPGVLPLSERTTQDFILLTAPIFFTGETGGYVDLIKATTSVNIGRDGPGWLIPHILAPKSWHLKEFHTMLEIQKSGNIPSPLTANYYSTTPYRLGPGPDQVLAPLAVKYSVRPCPFARNATLDAEDEAAFKSPHRSANYLGEAMKRRLAVEEVCFEFLVQEQGPDACLNPVEDPTVEWTGPATVVARLYLNKQVIGQEDHEEFCENMSFNPWHSLEAHRPLGAVNRARAGSYAAGAEFRLKLNNAVATVPTGRETFSGSLVTGVPPTSDSPTAFDYHWDQINPCCPNMIRTSATLPPDDQLVLSKRVNIAQNFVKSSLYYLGNFLSNAPNFHMGSTFRDPNDYAAWYNNSAVLGFGFPSSDAVAKHWEDDAFFGWQYLNGINPTVISVVQAMDDLAGAFGAAQLADMDKYLANGGRPGYRHPATSLQELVAGRRLFLADYRILEGHPRRAGTVLYSPVMLLYVPTPRVGDTSTARPLLPLGVQLSAGDAGRLILPSDSPAWLFTKMHVAQADAVLHESAKHLGDTHIVASGIITSFHRHMSGDHKLCKVLGIHFQQTLAFTLFGLDTLIKPTDHRAPAFKSTGLAAQPMKGIVQSMALGLEGFMRLIEEEQLTVMNYTLTWPERMAARGFYDPADPAFADVDADVDGFFSREDMFKFWHATHAYAQAVVDGLYDSDADVVADEALQTMASDLGEGGAQIRGAPTEFRDKATLVRFITNIIFTCTAEHNSVNFPQLRYYGFIPNRPYVLTRDIPQDLSKVTREYITSALPTDILEIIIFEATSRILSQETDVPLQMMNLPADLPQGVQRAFTAFKSSVVNLGEGRAPVFDIVYDTFKGNNTSSAIVL